MCLTRKPDSNGHPQLHGIYIYKGDESPKFPRNTLRRRDVITTRPYRMFIVRNRRQRDRIPTMDWSSGSPGITCPLSILRVNWEGVRAPE